VQRSEIAQNSADYGGGILAISLDPNSQAAGSAMQFLLVDSTVSGNVANQTVGGVSRAATSLPSSATRLSPPTPPPS
jgi:hypothetical protein